MIMLSISLGVNAEQLKTAEIVMLRVRNVKSVYQDTLKLAVCLAYVYRIQMLVLPQFLIVYSATCLIREDVLNVQMDLK